MHVLGIHTDFHTILRFDMSSNSLAAQASGVSHQASSHNTIAFTHKSETQVGADKAGMPEARHKIRLGLSSSIKQLFNQRP